MKGKLKLIVISAIVVGVIGGGFYFLLLSQPNKDKAIKIVSDQLFGWKYPVAKFPSVGPTGNQLAYSDVRDPGGVPQGLPVRLKIPTIGVDSAIEDALITPDGRMDVPAGSANVAWFALGPHPGQKGSAVIGGHFGIREGMPFVFYDLDKLKVGDKINIVNDNGDTLGFIVRAIKSFDRSADTTSVFTSDDGLAHLNLITCEGIWNQINDTYPQRLVVFADSVPTEGASPGTTTFYRSLDTGKKGEDVMALQTVLQQKGFLVMPSGIAKGYFGALTHVAVIKYQTSVGLPPVGTFGPKTKARLIADFGGNPIFPNAGADQFAISTSAKSSPGLVQLFVQIVGSLYTTPIDGIITSILFILILVMIFKIIW